MATVKLVNINKVYDNNVQAVFDFNLEIKDKEFIVFVGPSGCGKSTTLRMIAGLEEITDGELYIDDVLENDVASKNRNIAMVFQNYALYPHMTVYDNLAFGLKNRHVPKDEIDRRVQEAAEILDIQEYLDRKPKALSGGQCQRVALGRAIVRHAKVFLMDEPLSNLDAKLRVQMRTQIIKIHERIGATTIYVTHDQTEAMTMASRIVVMKKGRIQQIGTPRDIYNHPANLFVAGFIGSPSMNFLRGTFDGKVVRINDFVLNVSEEKKQMLKDYINKTIIIGIRPEDMSVSFEDNGKYKSEVDVVELLGHNQMVHCKIEGFNVQIEASSKHIIKMHDIIYVSIAEEFFHVFDEETEKTIF